MADIAVVVLVGFFYLMIVGLFIRARKHRLEGHRVAGDRAAGSGKNDGLEFDFSRSHRLVMEREKIDDMVNQVYREPMDQFFSLQQWKIRVAEYHADYRNYSEGRVKHCAKVKNLY